MKLEKRLVTNKKKKRNTHVTARNNWCALSFGTAMKYAISKKGLALSSKRLISPSGSIILRTVSGRLYETSLARMTPKTSTTR
jgi:hypothetical protein